MPKTLDEIYLGIMCSGSSAFEKAALTHSLSAELDKWQRTLT